MNVKCEESINYSRAGYAYFMRDQVGSECSKSDQDTSFAYVYQPNFQALNKTYESFFYI